MSEKHIYQCANCGVVFGPQSATDALATHVRLRAALEALVNKLDAVTEATTGVFSIAALHGVLYTGPNYGAELEEARKVLAMIK